MNHINEQGKWLKEGDDRDMLKDMYFQSIYLRQWISPTTLLPFQAILGKIERALEIKLRGKDKGAPLATKPKKAQAK